MLHTLFDLPITLVGPAGSGLGSSDRAKLDYRPLVVGVVCHEGWQWYYICVLPLAFVAPEAM